MPATANLTEKKRAFIGFKSQTALKERVERASTLKGQSLSEFITTVLTSYLDHFETKHNLNEITK